MRKKLLLEQLEALTYSYRQCSLKVNELKKENEALLSRIEELETELLAKNESEEGFVVNAFEEEASELETTNLEQIEEKSQSNVTIELDKSMEYGAEIIGKIIIESAKYSEKITSSQSENTKDLINLIMGKSEICKAEILNIATSSADFSDKCDMMNNQYTEAIDYFKSVVAQI